MGVTLVNNAHTTLAANISSTDTTIYVDDVSDFPTLGVGDYFYCTLESTTGTIEIVKVTQINSGSFIAVRGQENTIAVPFNIGARVELRLTVQNLEDQFADKVLEYISDTAYGAGWNGQVAIVPSQNAVYDKIETLLPSASYTAADVLSKLLTVDGTGSGLDADLLDGSHASAFATLAGANVFTHATGNTFNGKITTLSTLELGHASDTTIARDSAGNISVEGNAIYRANGTDVPVTDGGTGSSTAAGARTNLGFANGTYTPTLTGVANVAASTAYSCFYTQIGDVVHVAGRFDLDPTAGAGTWTRLRMTLPVASNFSASIQAAGTTVSYAGAANNYGAILADATNDEVELSMFPVYTGNQAWYFTFMYRVL